MSSNYRGRFAPTPSGPLHFGSIIAALGSYIQSHQNHGKWLVRIDDIDQSRAVAGANKIILEQLESLGLFWDESVVYQSQRLDLYQAALDELQQNEYTFPCACSRKDLSDKPYPGTCRNGITSGNKARSIRLKTNNNEVGINDFLQGFYKQCLQSEIGDFIIKRADGYFAYHLAVVVDDAEQNITDIVRGIDLLDSTPRQVYLQNKLNLLTPSYLHLPIAVDKNGKKISKADKAESITTNKPNEILFKALNFLGQKPDEKLKTYNVETILDWSIKNWDANSLPKEKEIIINPN
ncbi:MAG TPA: tRNA glutamyl-Q(34) synthetase GluQRS [Thiotrichaceae bacterium]|nr:tRNA glutamyl-Q(34) synthetase GluQRS [Thiotrichaceae bacterium]HIM09089.1 tRNA glutamyl-Q(34) synthetase GluQRS [Gammaproteobacteria bacterium]